MTKPNITNGKTMISSVSVRPTQLNCSKAFHALGAIRLNATSFPALFSHLGWERGWLECIIWYLSTEISELNFSFHVKFAKWFIELESMVFIVHMKLFSLRGQKTSVERYTVK